MKAHIRRVHTPKDDTYSCEMCAVRYLNQKALDKHFLTKDHIRTQAGEKPFKCETCGIPFTRVKSLKRHILTQHG